MPMTTNRPLTARQRLVLNLLANGERSIKDIEMDGFGISYNSAYKTLQQLWKRALIERTYRQDKLVWYLTRAGQEAVTSEDDDEC